MAEIVTLDNLADVIINTYQTYTDDVVAAIDVEADKTADLILEEVKKLAPKRTGEYAKNFTKTKKQSSSRVDYHVWNKKHYRRVHLLEYGHAKRGGGRVEGIPHVEPAADAHIPGYERRVEEIIKRGG
jgi:hypothetical protein